jgi:hypothetical protein
VGYLGVEIFFPLAVVGLIVLGLVAVGSGRRDADHSGGRPYAMYLSVISFIALFTLVFAVAFAVTELVSIPLDDRSGSDCIVTEFGEECFGNAGGDTTDEHLRDGLRVALVAVAAGVILRWHLRRIDEQVAGPGFAQSPARLTYIAFGYAVCFVAMAVLLVEASLVAFSALKILGPGVFGNTGDTGLDRNQGVIEMVAALVPALASYALFRWQWAKAEQLRAPVTRDA